MALAKYAARGKQYLVMVRAVDEGLVMQQLLYADEIRPISEVGLDRRSVKDAELKLAKMLVDQASSDEFRPEAYEDEVKKRIQQQLKKKIETGQEISRAAASQERRGHRSDGGAAAQPRQGAGAARAQGGVGGAAQGRPSGPAAVRRRRPPRRSSPAGESR